MEKVVLKFAVPEAEATQEIKVPCLIYSRVVGYLRPIQNWNDGKQEEFWLRKTFDKALSP